MKVYAVTTLIFVFCVLLTAKEIRSGFSDSAPVIDGILSASEWNSADSTSDFIQLHPQKGERSSEETIVYVSQNDEYLFIAFKCFQQNNVQVTANITTRDQLTESDDAVMILIDTFNDQRTGFAFWLNPVGTQTDLYITDDGRNEDLNWDTEWQGYAKITNFGWTAEMAIPFKHIRYDDKLQTWGVNFARVIRSNAETAYWSGNINDNYRISQGGQLTNLKLPPKDRNLILTPYTTLRYENSNLIKNHDDWIIDAGGDASYKITTGVRLDATYNPDFATVEGDQEQLNLTRWELSFPEKRLFFLEGNALYSTRIRTFYSRRIGDIDYGGKITGKVNDYNFSALSTRTAADSALGLPAAWFSAVRLKKDVFKSSAIGVTLVDKNWSGGYTRSLSGDFILNPGVNWKITGQFVTSAPGLTMAHSAYFVRIANESNLHHIHFRYSDTGTKFKENVNQTGFIRDDDMREMDSDLSYIFWLQQSMFKYIAIESRNNVFWSHRGTLRSWYITEKARFYLKNNISFEISYNDEFKLYEKKYYNHKYNMKIGYNTDEWEMIEFDFTWGHNFDRDFKLYRFEVQQRFFNRLAVRYRFEKIDFSPDFSLSSTNLNIITLDYNFTRDLWLRLFTQTNSREDRYYIYGLFGWRFLPPFSALYLIYTSDRFDELIYRKKNDILFVKLSYQFGI